MVRSGLDAPAGFKQPAFANRFIKEICVVIGVMSVTGHLLAQPEPLPLDLVATLSEVQTGYGHGWPVDLSPDGAWVAYEVSRNGYEFGSSGTLAAHLPPRLRAQARVTNLKTKENILLGDAHAYSWNAAWSPDSRKLIFFSVKNNDLGIWLWNRQTRRTERFPDVEPSWWPSVYGAARWTSDNRRVLCTVLPTDIQPQTISGQGIDSTAKKDLYRFPKVDRNQPSVFVLKAPAEKAGKPENIEYSVADLALLDLRDSSVTRIARRADLRWYELSPDNRYVGYTVSQGSDPNSWQGNYDLFVYEMATGKTQRIGKNLKLTRGVEINWSPNSRYLAYISGGLIDGGNTSGLGQVVILSVDGQVLQQTEGEGHNFTNGAMRPPFWDSAGNNIFAIGEDGALWNVEVASGRVEKRAAIEGRQITSIAVKSEDPTLWTADSGRTVWVFTKNAEEQKSGIFSLELATGRSQVIHEVPGSIASSAGSFDASSVSGDIAYVAGDRHHPGDIWILSTHGKKVREAVQSNPGLGNYKLGNSRVIEWLGMDGQKIRGALLLPADYRKGQRVPLVVKVYASYMGSGTVNAFGLLSIPALNMQVLATRGYAVLFPDSPIREGELARDLFSSVMSGVNAAIDAGYADPDRLAVMGHSLGSYSTLALLTQTTRFKAAIISGASVDPNLLNIYLALGPDGSLWGTGYFENGRANLGGTPWEYPERYREHSLLYSFDKIETPLLIGQGTLDGSPEASSDLIFAALKRLNKSVEYRLYQGEGHTIDRAPNIIDFWRRRIDFLDEHLDVTRNPDN